MPKNKNGHNETHNIKQSLHYEKGRSFADNRSQQERLAKLLFQKEKKLRNAREAEQRAQQEAERRARQEAARDQRAFNPQWMRDHQRFHPARPNFNGFQQAHNQPFANNRENVEAEENHVHFGRPGL